MHFLDFLSGSPKIFIFQQETAKTNLGGILFLIYIIIMLSISLAYIIDYAINDKYTYEIKNIDNTTNNEILLINGIDYNPLKKLNKDNDLNPLINFSIFASSLFSIYDIENNDYLEGVPDEEFGFEYSWFNITRRVDDLKFELRYICGNDSNCTSIYEEDIEGMGFALLLPAYKIDHQAEIPLKIVKDMSIVSHFYDFHDDMLAKLDIDWEVIKYEDQKSIFDSLTNNKKEYIYGHLKPDSKLTETRMLSMKYYIKHGYKNYKKIYYISFMSVNIMNNHYGYLLYTRKKVEFLDILAKIGALFSTIKFFFSLIFNYYSKNFDNYKILGKVLNNQKKPIKKKIELSSGFNTINTLKSEEEEEEEKETINQIKDMDNKDPLLEKISNENKININKEFDINKNINEDDSIILNKLSFIDFYYNNIYCNCCKKRKNQEIINSVNEIMYKYLSIDNLLYNQLILEGLFKDYKWNNPSLRNILDNSSIKDLRTIVT